MHADTNKLNELSEAITGHGFTVLNILGAGFLEKIYEDALAYELRKTGLAVGQDRTVVGKYFVDLLVEDILLVGLKTMKPLAEAHRAQCVNYLRATSLPLCLLLNLGTSRLEIKRVANDPRPSTEICIKPFFLYCRVADALLR